MLTIIADRKIPCVYIHFYQITKNWGPGPYNSLHHVDNRRYFLGLYLTWNRREVHMFYLVREVGKFGHVLVEKKGNCRMINEFKYGETWKICPSPLSLSLYSIFKVYISDMTFSHRTMKFCHLFCHSRISSICLIYTNLDYVLLTYSHSQNSWSY